MIAMMIAMNATTSAIFFIVAIILLIHSFFILVFVSFPVFIID